MLKVSDSVSKSIKILLIGPCLNKDSTNLGGATVSFHQLADYLTNSHLKCTILDSQYIRLFPSSFWNLSRILILSLIYAPFNDLIFLNLSQPGIKYLSPFIYLIARLFKKKIVIRPFGGSLWDHYQKYGIINRWFFNNTVARADILYLQTRDLCQKFNWIYGVRHLVTAREKIRSTVDKLHFDKKLVYVGQIKETKGMDDLLKLRSMLDESYTLDIYGPILEKKYMLLQNEKFYRGVFSPTNISEILSKYDVLIFPTYYSGEGYPGVIIEAYAASLPVISTEWKAIPEIVLNGHTGLLVNPGSPDELFSAVLKLSDKKLYSNMSKNAKNHFDQNFSKNQVLKKVTLDLETLID